MAGTIQNTGGLSNQHTLQALTSVLLTLGPSLLWKINFTYTEFQVGFLPAVAEEIIVLTHNIIFQDSIQVSSVLTRTRTT